MYYFCNILEYLVYQKFLLGIRKSGGQITTVVFSNRSLLWRSRHQI